MRSFGTIAIACALLSPGMAFAAAVPQTAAPPASPCALALQTGPTAQQADAPRRRKKISLDFLYDPCHMDDTDKKSEVANNDGLSPEEKQQRIDESVEWNRRQSGDAGSGLPWLAPARPGDAPPDGQTPAASAARHPRTLADGRVETDVPRLWSQQMAAMPAVPEAPGYRMWLGGLALLAAWTRRRRRR